jgi:hypothetical protein
LSYFDEHLMYLGWASRLCTHMIIDPYIVVENWPPSWGESRMNGASYTGCKREGAAMYNQNW